MLDLGKTAAPALLPPLQSELTTGDLLGGLETQAGKVLIFSYEGRDVLPGYHVTEVKDGVFQGLDCGGNPESWRETFIQLWDIPPEDDRGFLPIARFLAIMRKVADHLPFDPHAKLTFEVSDGRSAIQLFRADGIEADEDRVRVALSRRPASCKPRDRWLEQQQARQCCGSPAQDKSRGSV